MSSFYGFVLILIWTWTIWKYWRPSKTDINHDHAFLISILVSGPLTVTWLGGIVCDYYGVWPQWHHYWLGTPLFAGLLASLVGIFNNNEGKVGRDDKREPNRCPEEKGKAILRWKLDTRDSSRRSLCIGSRSLGIGMDRGIGLDMGCVYSDGSHSYMDIGSAMDRNL